MKSSFALQVCSPNLITGAQPKPSFSGSERASTGYLVWRDGRAAVMVDVAGGTFLRFGEAGARLDDLSVLAISHLHPDHVTDLPGLLWLSDAARAASLSHSKPGRSVT